MQEFGKKNANCVHFLILGFGETGLVHFGLRGQVGGREKVA